jgi:arylsulfatase A-like enzyme
MERHRPYGTGGEAVPSGIDRNAEAAGGRRWFGSSTVSEEQREVILEKYRAALGRVDDRIERLLYSIDADDPVFAFTADHGDEFGEEEYYYHQGSRRRVADTIIEVPVVLDGVETHGDRLSLIDIAPTLAAGAGVEIPDAWQGNDLTDAPTETAITIAPWHDKATVAWQDFERKLVARDADVSLEADGEEVEVERSDVSDDVEQQLQNLGYTDAG